MIDLRPRRPTELIDASFVIMRGRFARFVALAAFVMAPYLLVSQWLVIRFGAQAEERWSIELWTLNLVCNAVAHAALCVAVSEVYHGRSLDVAAALRRTLPKAWTLVSTALIAGMLTVIGFVFLVVPGLFLAAQFFAIPAVAVLENQDFSGTFRRSTRLADSQTKPILLSYGLTWLILVLVSGAMEALAGWGLFGDERPVLANFIADLMEVVTAPVLAAVTTLLYYDLRIRKEGYDIEVMAAGVTSPPPDPLDAAGTRQPA